MAKQRSRASTEVISFRRLVKDCAQEPQLVASFNRAYGMQLQAPIAALLEDRWPLGVSEEEEMQIGCFIIFVHEHIWRRLQRLRCRIRARYRTRVPRASGSAPPDSV